MAKLGLEKPAVNQIELHPWQQKPDIVKYCLEHDITVMGYSPLAKGQKVQDKTVCQIAEKLSKTPAQILIRWSVQHGFITIPKTSQKDRLASNADVFNWSIPDEDMKVLVSLKFDLYFVKFNYFVIGRTWQQTMVMHMGSNTKQFKRRRFTII